MKKMHITVNGALFDVEVEVYEDDEQSPYLMAQRSIARQSPQESYSKTQGNTILKTQMQKSEKKSVQSDMSSLTSPINGIILEIPVSVGSKVVENDILFVLESMKMKTNISSPRTGTISAIHVKTGDTIESGQLLLNYE